MSLILIIGCWVAVYVHAAAVSQSGAPSSAIQVELAALMSAGLEVGFGAGGRSQAQENR